jgi:hypothetical protein
MESQASSALQPQRLLQHQLPRALLAAGFFILIWQRCPTILTRAQFWAEDGWAWYPNAYQHGWQTLFWPQAGYLQTISRLVALASLAAPLADAPLIFASAGLLVQGAAPSFLLSPRMEAAIPAFPVRLALALLLVALPGTNETFVNLTNAQWYLSLLAFLVLCAAPATSLPQRAFDGFVLTLSGLSGPFALCLTPVAFMCWWRGREPWQKWRLAIITATALLQFFVLLYAHGQRIPGELTARLHGFAAIIAAQIIAPAMLGLHRVLQQGQFGLTTPGGTAFALGASIAAALLATTAFLRGSRILKYFLLFTSMEFAGSLFDGIVPHWWLAMQNAPGGRYFLHPIIAWIAILLSLTCDHSRTLRTIGGAGLAMVLLLAIPSDYQLPKLPRTDFHQQARAFTKSPPGTVAVFPVRPAGQMVLINH